MLTGDMTKNVIVYPSFSSLISYVKADENKSGLFPYITLTASSTRFNEAGIFEVDGIVNPQISESRLANRRNLLNAINSSSNRVAKTSEVKKLEVFQTSRTILHRGY